MKPTRQLFEEVINTRGIHQQLGWSSDVVRGLRRNLKEGKVSLDKMHEVLHLAGYQIVQETKWSK
jgi:hypothetical protein